MKTEHKAGDIVIEGVIFKTYWVYLTPSFARGFKNYQHALLLSTIILLINKDYY